MPNYSVTVPGSHSWTVEVEAVSDADAKAKAISAWESGEIEGEFDQGDFEPEWDDCLIMENAPKPATTE